MYQVVAYLHQEKHLTINVLSFKEFDQAEKHAQSIELNAKDLVQIERYRDEVVVYERNRKKAEFYPNGKNSAPTRKCQFTCLFCGLDGGYYFPEIGLGVGNSSNKISS